ncbi:C-terminal helicase domain-containing protein [Sinorhizobium meliloti]|nr:C-terminal helicase domain-containing protein [Sinorhizobium meliloti]
MNPVLDYLDEFDRRACRTIHRSRDDWYGHEITRLCQACCHPRLAVPDSRVSPAKLETFLELAEELREGRLRALVFSQFVGHLDEVRAALGSRGFSYQYLDGSTPVREREKRVAAFSPAKANCS